MAIVSLISIGLYYTPIGLHLESVLFSICYFTIGIGSLALYRWGKIHPDIRFFISFSFSLPKANNKLDRILSAVLVIAIIMTIMTFVFVILSPRSLEKSTEFYLLGPEGKATDYPKNLIKGENKNIILGIINHEYRTINYTMEIWLINQTFMFNDSSHDNVTVFNHMWFMDKFSIMLNYSTRDKEQIWARQWEYNYTFSINRTGTFRLVFLLYTVPTEQYTRDLDYRGIAEDKFNSAYKNVFLWLNVV
jgi:uncharacterized membrane protein